MLLWASLFIYIAVQLGLIARFCWELIHPANYVELFWSIAANLASGVVGAYTARRFVKRTPGEEQLREILMKSIDDKDNSS